MQSKYVYEDNWDAFIRKIKQFGPTTRVALKAEAVTDGKLSMIEALSRDYRTRESQADAQRRTELKQGRILEAQRMTPQADAFRPYVDDATQAMMPTIAVHRATPDERKVRSAHARQFWNGIRRGSVRGLSLQRMIEKATAVPFQARLLATPYGPAVSDEEIRALEARIRSARPRHRMSVNPAGMTPERALQIAMKSLERS